MYPPIHPSNGSRDQSVDWSPHDMWPGDRGTIISKYGKNCKRVRRIRCDLNGTIVTSLIVQKETSFRNDYTVIARTRVIFDERLGK